MLCKLTCSFVDKEEQMLELACVLHRPWQQVQLSTADINPMVVMQGCGIGSSLQIASLL